MAQPLPHRVAHRFVVKNQVSQGSNLKQQRAWRATGVVVLGGMAVGLMGIVEATAGPLIRYRVP
jgi:hypothetical protein